MTEHSPIPEGIRTHSAWGRLNTQLTWYDTKSLNCQRLYKVTKIVQLVAAAAIPIVSLAIARSNVLTAILGASVALLEGVQQLWQWSTLWVTYRATAERLKHEKYLFLGGAGPYRDFDEASRLRLLAERVEEHVSNEHAAWVADTRRGLETTTQPTKP